jgi:predicted nucleotide-binding protein
VAAYGNGSVSGQASGGIQGAILPRTHCATTRGTQKPPAAAKLFVLQSRDREARDEIERVLIHHGLRPIVLQKGDGSSQTIVEVLNRYIQQGTGFEIAMLSPGD